MSLSSPATAGELKIIDNVPHILNQSTPPNGERTLTLQETWSVNVEDEEELIGVISTAIAGPEATVWLTDNQLGQVLVYSATGEHLRTLSRSGEGPGELNHPTRLLWLPDGGLGIIDRKRGQITHIDTEGLPLVSIRLQDAEQQPLASAWIRGARCNGGTLVANGTLFQQVDDVPTQTRFLSIFSPDGTEINRLMEAPSGFNFRARTYDEQADYFANHGKWTIDERGDIHHVPHFDRYLIEVHDAAGKLIRVVERDHKPGRRTDERKEEIRDGVSMNINGEVVQISCKLEDSESAIRHIESVAGGELWVRNGDSDEDLPEGIVRIYDVFDAAGHFQEVVRLACEMNPDQDQLLRLADDRWILLKNIISARNAMYAAYLDDESGAEDEEAEPLMIVCLRPVAK